MKYNLDSYKDSIRTTVTFICGDIDIKFGKTSATRKDCMYIKFPEAEDHDAIMHSYADCIHESFHIKYKTFDLCDIVVEKRKRAHVNPDHFYPVAKVIEDYRVNSLGMVDFPGEGEVLKLAYKLRARDQRLDKTTEVLFSELHNLKYITDIAIDMDRIKDAKELAIDAPFMSFDEVSDMMFKVFDVI